MKIKGRRHRLNFLLWFCKFQITNTLPYLTTNYIQWNSNPSIIEEKKFSLYDYSIIYLFFLFEFSFSSTPIPRTPSPVPRPLPSFAPIPALPPKQTFMERETKKKKIGGITSLEPHPPAQKHTQEKREKKKDKRREEKGNRFSFGCLGRKTGGRYFFSLVPAATPTPAHPPPKPLFFSNLYLPSPLSGILMDVTCNRSPWWVRVLGVGCREEKLDGEKKGGEVE